MKIGVATNKYAFNDELWEKYRKNGIDAIELDLLHADDVQKCDIKKVKEFADKHDVKLWSVHLPFYPFEVIDLSSTDEALRIKTVEFLKKQLKKWLRQMLIRWLSIRVPSQSKKNVLKEWQPARKAFRSLLNSQKIRML